MENNQDSTNEKVKEWDELSAYEIKAVTLAIAQGYRDGEVDVSNERMLRILSLGKPKWVLVYMDGKLKNFRVHKDSVDVMRLIADSYVQRTILEEIEEEFPDMLDEMRKEGF